LRGVSGCQNKSNRRRNWDTGEEGREGKRVEYSAGRQVWQLRGRSGKEAGDGGDGGELHSCGGVVKKVLIEGCV
jgi:hypothetical protein